MVTMAGAVPWPDVEHYLISPCTGGGAIQNSSRPRGTNSRAPGGAANPQDETENLITSAARRRQRVQEEAARSKTGVWGPTHSYESESTTQDVAAAIGTAAVKGWNTAPAVAAKSMAAAATAAAVTPPSSRPPRQETKSSPTPVAAAIVTPESSNNNNASGSKEGDSGRTNPQGSSNGSPATTSNSVGAVGASAETRDSPGGQHPPAQRSQQTKQQQQQPRSSPLGRLWGQGGALVAAAVAAAAPNNNSSKNTTDSPVSVVDNNNENNNATNGKQTEKKDAKIKFSLPQGCHVDVLADLVMGGGGGGGFCGSGISGIPRAADGAPLIPMDEEDVDDTPVLGIQRMTPPGCATGWPSRQRSTSPNTGGGYNSNANKSSTAANGGETGGDSSEGAVKESDPGVKGGGLNKGNGATTSAAASAAAAANGGRGDVIRRVVSGEEGGGGSVVERRRMRHQARLIRNGLAGDAHTNHEEIEVSPNHHVQIHLPPTDHPSAAQRNGKAGGTGSNSNRRAPLDTLEVKPDHAAELERSISELTMRSSYGGGEASLAKIPDNRRMAYYAVGKNHRNAGRGGNRRCYFTGKLILGGAPFYAGAVQQGLRTLVVFCLPSALGLPAKDMLTGKNGAQVRTRSSADTSGLITAVSPTREGPRSRTGTNGSWNSSGPPSPRSPHDVRSILSRSKRQLSYGGGASVASKSMSRLSSLDDLSLSIEGDLDPNWGLDRDYLLKVLPEVTPDLLKQMALLYPEQFETLPMQVRKASKWRLYIKFCFFSGLPIAEGEMHYKVRDALAEQVYGEEIVLSHEVMEAVNGDSAEILTLPNQKAFRYLRRHYAQQCCKLDDVVFRRINWERVAPEV